MRNILTDILVIGSGGAGLRAALAAREHDPRLKVTIITPGTIGTDSVTATACSDRMAFHVAFEHTPPGGEQAWKEHAKDIYVGGGYVSDPNLAVLLAYKARDAFDYLDKLGVPWVRTADGKPDQFLTDGSTYPRACYTGPYTARDIHRALLDEVRRQDITILEGMQIIGLSITDSPEHQGIMLFNREMKKEVFASARAAILATGGPGSLFGSPLYPDNCNAVPLFHAILNGAKLVNLEFIQYGLVSSHTKLACSGSLPRALPKVVDETGREFLMDIRLPEGFNSYLELLFMKGANWPVSAESLTLPIDIAIHRITSSSKKVLFDFRENPSGLNREIYRDIVLKKWKREKQFVYAETPIERLRQANPQVIDWFKERGLDLHQSPVEVKHEVQHFQGGILINERAETGVPGLYACGECAGGQHGANRPGGNSLLDGQVMGAIAGRQAAKYASRKYSIIDYAASAFDNNFANMDQLIKPFGQEPDEVEKKLRDILQRAMVVHRSDEALSQALNELDELSRKGIRPGSLVYPDSLPAIAGFFITMAFLQAASHRAESRGSHIFVKSTQDPTPLPIDEPRGRVWKGVWKNEFGKLEVSDIPIPKPKIKK